MLKQRFLCVNGRGTYFRGEKANFTDLYNSDEYVYVVDLTDFVLERVKVGVLRDNNLEPAFLNYVGCEGNRAAIRIGCMENLFASYHHTSYIGVDGIQHTIDIAGKGAWIDNVECGTDNGDCETDDECIVYVNNHGSLVEIFTLDEDFPAYVVNFMFPYRLGNSLILCYQIMRVKTDRTSEYLSVSAAYDISTADFQGFFLYGNKAMVKTYKKKYWLKWLAKEAYRG